MRNTHPRRPSGELRPIVESGKSSRRRGDDADPDTKIGRLVASYEVQNCRHRPRANRNVGEDRMERVADPWTMQRRLQRPPRATREQSVLYSRLNHSGYLVGDRKILNRRDDRF